MRILHELTHPLFCSRGGSGCLETVDHTRRVKSFHCLVEAPYCSYTSTYSKSEKRSTYRKHVETSDKLEAPARADLYQMVQQCFARAQEDVQRSDREPSNRSKGWSDASAAVGESLQGENDRSPQETHL